MENLVRSLHMIDVENQLGTGHISADAVTTFFECYVAALKPGKLDQIVVAVSSHQALLELPLSALRNFRLLYKPGHNGADLALQQVMLGENVSERFQTVICASGDGGFTEAVSHLAGLGTRVVVVGQEKSIAKRLRMAAHQTIELSNRSTEKDAA